MTEIPAINGNSRRKSNTALLLGKAVEGVREAHADAEEWENRVRQKGVVYFSGAAKGKRLF